MRKKLSILVLLILAAPVVALLNSSRASATFNQNNIIDDSVFSNSGSMTAAQIDSFLNNFPSSCISSKNSFSSPEPVGYTPSGGYIYGSNVSAGTIIYDLAKVYSINPQVFLATLQKEQSLVSGEAGCHPNTPDPANTFQCNLWGTGNIPCTSACPYAGGCIPIALGNNCPGNCQASTEGFSKQLTTAAWKLKYWQQRSEGNVNWNVQVRDFPHPGNVWDNSDDVTSGSSTFCYSGLRMTEGYYQLCPNGSFATYDGLSNVKQYSGGPTVTVHLDNGATAALYNWTPFLSGNQNFVSIFEGWFGSTRYYEPVGGILYNQSSNGKVYLVTADNNTKYYISGPAVLNNYGLQKYQIVPTDDATINQYTDGGNLTSIIYDNGDVYLVNSGSRYYVPGPATCTAWGFDCGTAQQLGSTFMAALPSGPINLNSLANYGGVVYKMDTGLREPIANPATLSALGYTLSQAIAANSVNIIQPLGPLLITTPTPIRFASGATIYYFDGNTYHPIPNPSVQQAWNMGNVYLPQKSSYDTTPPSPGASMTRQYQDSSANKYLIDSGRKLKLSTSQQSLWSSYQTFASEAADKLPTGSLSNFVWANPDFYLLDSTAKHHVPTYDDYLGLGFNSKNTTPLQGDALSAVAKGGDAFADGKLVSIGANIYVVNNHMLLYIPGPGVFSSFGFNWGKVYNYPQSIETDYPVETGDLSRTLTSDWFYNIIIGQRRIKLNGPMASDYGLIISPFKSLNNLVNAKLKNGELLSRFMYNVDNGRIYYASGGAIHYVSSYSSFVAYGGTNTNSTPVDSVFLNNFKLAQPI